MKKLFVTLFLGVFLTVCANAQLLYKISGNGLEKPSYIFGTYKYANVSYVDRNHSVWDAIQKTDQMYGEVSWNDMLRTDSMMYEKDAMKLSGYLTLKDVLSSEQYKQVDAFLNKLLGVGLSNPEVGDEMGRMTPLAVANQITMLMYLQVHMGEFDATNKMENYFQAQARKNNEVIDGLESIVSRTNIIYRSMPMRQQIGLLMCTINNADYNNALLERITKAYYSQDLNAIRYALNERYNNRCEPIPEEDNRIITQRNIKWMAKIPKIMSGHPTLFVVSVSHLPGDNGILKLLKNAGYTVEGITY